jgi:hypothetical protein
MHNGMFVPRSVVIYIKNFKIPIFSQGNDKRLPWENVGIFSQSQPRIHFVKSQYGTFRGVNWKILRLHKVLLQFMEKEGDG